MLDFQAFRDTLYQNMKTKKYTRLELTEDGLHPNDKGHGLVVRKITTFLEVVKEHMFEKIGRKHDTRANDCQCI